MPHTTSADGTTISYERLSEQGPTLVLAGGDLDDPQVAARNALPSDG